MAKQAAQPAEAWGLEIGGSALRLVHLVRRRGEEGDGTAPWAVASFEQTAWSAEQGPSLGEALGSLSLPEAGAAVGVCIGDEAVLYRRLELPPADDAVRNQMVRSQMEVLLPLSPEQLAWGWGPAGNDDAAVLLCAARRELSEPLSQSGVGLKPTVTVTSAIAAAEGLRRLDETDADGQGDDAAVLLLDVAAQATTLTVVGSAGVEHVATVSVGGDALVAVDGERVDDESLEQWQRELSAAYRQMLQELAGRPAPGRCVVIGRGGRWAEVQRAASEATGLSVVPVSPPRGITLPDGITADEAYPAIGAAMHALEPSEVTIALGQGRESRAPAGTGRVVSVRALVAAAVILLAVVALYQMDLRHADRLESATASIQADAAQTRQLAQALALGQYLQQQPPPPLVVLDALSKGASERVQVTQWQYDRRGRVQISGTVRGVGELDRTLTRLTATPPFDAVDLRSASNERDTWTFEIEAELMPLHRHVALAAQSDGRQEVTEVDD